MNNLSFAACPFAFLSLPFCRAVLLSGEGAPLRLEAAWDARDIRFAAYCRQGNSALAAAPVAAAVHRAVYAAAYSDDRKVPDSYRVPQDAFGDGFEAVSDSRELEYLPYSAYLHKW